MYVCARVYAGEFARRVKERERAHARGSVCSKVREKGFEIRSHDGHGTNTKAVYVRLNAMRVVCTCVRAYLRYTFVGVDVEGERVWMCVEIRGTAQKDLQLTLKNFFLQDKITRRSSWL